MVLRVYLDSSDYSVLTNPSCQTPHLISIRERLSELAASGLVEFRFSSAHICEMSPLALAYVGAAELRAALLVALCGSKALISFDRLMEREIVSLARRDRKGIDPFSNMGDWAPIPEDTFFSGFEPINPQGVQELGANRAQKRALKKKIFKNGQIKQSARKEFAAREDENLREILDQFPMRAQDALTLRRYFLGDASKSDALAAFNASIRDPIWMMQWFRKNFETMNPFIAWLRGPAERMRSSVEALAQIAGQSRQFSANLSPKEIDVLQLDHKERKAMQARWLLQISQSVLNHEGMPTTELSIDELSRFAPGFYVCITSFVDALWASVGEKPRVPKGSDFVDAVHATYAPYVDIFRTDGFMAPIIAANSKRYGTTVVGKLTDLVSAIEYRLNS